MHRELLESQNWPKWLEEKMEKMIKAEDAQIALRGAKDSLEIAMSMIEQGKPDRAQTFIHQANRFLAEAQIAVTLTTEAKE